MSQSPARLVSSALCALALLLGVTACVTRPIPQARLSSSGYITAGDTNFWLIATGKAVSVVEVDGAAPEHSQGPIELSPGIHKVKLKCNDRISDQEVSVAAGDVFQFSVYVDPNDHHVEGRLQKIRSTRS